MATKKDSKTDADRLAKTERRVEAILRTLGEMDRRQEQRDFLCALYALSDDSFKKYVAIEEIESLAQLHDSFPHAQTLALRGLIDYPGAPIDGPTEYRLTEKGRRFLLAGSTSGS